MRRTLLLLLTASMVLTACSEPDVIEDSNQAEAGLAATTTTSPPAPTTSLPEFEVTSPEWSDGEPIPTSFTCDGADLSPQLDLAGVPSSAPSLAIIVDDPDAPLGTWDHWVEFNIPAGDTIPEDASGSLGAPGVNSWNVGGYMGPCPPAGETHVYVFTVYALDGTLDIPEDVDSDALRKAMAGRIIAQDTLTGSYARP